jgi:hypothetical protein
MLKKVSILFSALLIILGGGLSGCGKVQIDLDNLTAPPLPFLSLSHGAEFVSSSQQGHPTLKGYTVEASAGSSFGGIQSTTLSGYKVYTSMQGELISQNEDIIISEQAAARR